MRIARAQQLHKHAALQACLRARGQLRLRRLRDNVKQQQGHVLRGAEGSCVQCCEALHIAPQRHHLAASVRPHLADARGQVCAQDSRLWQRRTMRCTVLLQLHTQAMDHVCFEIVDGQRSPCKSMAHNHRLRYSVACVLDATCQLT